MAELSIDRSHTLGLIAARQVAQDWVRAGEERFGLSCQTTLASDTGAADACDHILFSRSGVSGSLLVTPGRFVLNAKLGFLLSAYKGPIEAEMRRQLDALLGPEA
jgi:putative polyhydroxyalkanoate system protein